MATQSPVPFDSAMVVMEKLEMLDIATKSFAPSAASELSVLKLYQDAD
jgi:hypothetical protein